MWFVWMRYTKKDNISYYNNNTVLFQISTSHFIYTLIFLANISYWPNAGLMPAHYLRRRPSTKPASGQHISLDGRPDDVITNVLNP